MIYEFIVKIVERRATPYVVLVAFLSFMLFPIYWTGITSLKTLAEIYSTPITYLPSNPYPLNYVHAFTKLPLATLLRNSLTIALITSLVVVPSATFTAYGITQFKFRASEKMMAIMLLCRFLPPPALMVAFYFIFNWLGILNTLTCLILFCIYLNYPLVVWLLKGYFEEFPREIIESSLVDGCSRIMTVFRIVVPVAAPAIASVFTVSFLWSWNEFLAPALFIISRENMPITLGFKYYMGEEQFEWGYMSAAALIGILPTVIMFIILQRHIIKGMVTGAIKG